jgi:hypothetical protein
LGERQPQVYDAVVGSVKVAIHHNQSMLVPLLPFSQFSMTVTTSMVI